MEDLRTLFRDIIVKEGSQMIDDYEQTSDKSSDQQLVQ